MDLKDQIYQLERFYLSPFAAHSNASKGRQYPITDCPLRTDYARDRDKIVHSKAFRRLKHKTQVFLSPEGDHYRTRLTHTLEVAQIARTICRGLRLNEDLTEAIALGHDLGHTPYGHAGEAALQSFCHFAHNEQSLRIATTIENGCKGMNLTFESQSGILNHRFGLKNETLEGAVVAFADKIAYISHDIDDIIRAGLLTEDDLPKQFSLVLGNSHSKRINTIVLDIIKNSINKPAVSPSSTVLQAMMGLRAFLTQNFYCSGEIKAEEGKAKDMIKFLFEHFYKNIDLLPKDLLALDSTKEQKVCDHISTFTDRFAVKVFESITVPKNWK
ncbi:MAG: deoxyguanosinetriphosphate triphosphohydrolase [Firmicutes bacterium]|nr:deoxyguanosinetriphosphate triphosphohydrolase [Bacillota bacterium]